MARPENKLKGCTSAIEYIAKRSEGGLLVDLNAIYIYHAQKREELKHLLIKPESELTPKERHLVCRFKSNAQALLGVKVNQPVQRGNLAYIHQAWGYTSTGRLLPRHGGWLTLSKEYRDIGLAPVTSDLQPRYEYDLRAAQVNVLLKLVQNDNQDLLIQYATDNKLRKQWAKDIGVDINYLKRAIIALMFGCYVPTVKQYETMADSFDYTFADCFGPDLYERALSVLTPFIRQVHQSIDQLIDTAHQRRNNFGLTFTNALGLKYLVENADIKKDGKVKEQVKRYVAAFLLQGGEQIAIYSVFEANNENKILSYEYDGFVTDRPIEFEPAIPLKLELKSTNVGN